MSRRANRSTNFHRFQSLVDRLIDIGQQRAAAEAPEGKKKLEQAIAEEQAAEAARLIERLGAAGAHQIQTV